MYWVIAALVLLFGVALYSRFGGARLSAKRPARRQEPIFPAVPPLQSGESYDTAVKLATLPNVPLADLWCQRLQEEGIEAFSKDAGVAPYSGIEGGTGANPAWPAEVWVGQHDLERARELFPELA